MTEYADEGTTRASYGDKVVGKKRCTLWEEMEALEDDMISNDDLIKEDRVTLFGMSMTHEEKIEARQPWYNNVIVMVIGRSVGHH